MDVCLHIWRGKGCPVSLSELAQVTVMVWREATMLDVSYYPGCAELKETKHADWLKVFGTKPFILSD